MLILISSARGLEPGRELDCSVLRQNVSRDLPTYDAGISVPLLSQIQLPHVITDRLTLHMDGSLVGPRASHQDYTYIGKRGNGGSLA